MKNLIKEQISQDEKTRILELHNILKESELNKKNRKSLSEQTKPPVDQEEYMNNVKKQCTGFNDAVVWTIPNENVAFLYKNDKTYEYWYSADGTYDITSQNKDGVRELVKQNLKWYCKKLTQDEYSNSPQTVEFNSLIKAGWKPKEELLKLITPDEINSLYQQHPVYRNLYKRKGDPVRTTNYTEDQLAFINSWSADTENKQNIDQGMYKINPTAADLATGDWSLDKYFIAPNSERDFPGGLKVYVNASKKLEPTRSYCRTKIKEFAAKYKRRNSNPSTRQYIETTRTFIQDCVEKYLKNNKFTFGGLSDELNLLGGMVEGGVENNNDPWYIRLPRKL